jgi:hypothetical protein
MSIIGQIGDLSESVINGRSARNARCPGHGGVSTASIVCFAGTGVHYPRVARSTPPAHVTAHLFIVVLGSHHCAQLALPVAKWSGVGVLRSRLASACCLAAPNGTETQRLRWQKMAAIPTRPNPWTTHPFSHQSVWKRIAIASPARRSTCCSRS